MTDVEVIEIAVSVIIFINNELSVITYSDEAGT